MVKRASTDWALRARAVNRNALSGGKGLTCPGACAPTSHASAAGTASKHALRRGDRRFGGDPVEVFRQSIGDRDSDDFREFVGMSCPDRGLQAWIEPRSGLYRKRDFRRRFDLPAPVIK